MTYVLNLMFRLIFCVFDALMIYRFIKSMFKRKIDDRHLIISFFCIIMMVFIVNSFSSSSLNLFIIPIFSFVFIKYTFFISYHNGVIYTIIFCVIFAGGREVAFEMLFRLIENIFQFSIFPWFTPAGIQFLLFEYLISFFILLYMEKFTKKLAISEDKILSACLLILPITSVLIWGCFIYLDFPEVRLTQILMCSGAFLLYFSNIAVFIIIGQVSSLTNRAKYAELCLLKKDMEADHFQNIAKINERYKQYMHDLNKYISNIRMLASEGNYQKIIEIIDERQIDIQKNTVDSIYSNNIVLNAILSERVYRAKEKGIEITIFVEPIVNADFVSDYDKISLFGNLLDNALEAAAQCNAGERKVNIKLFMKNGSLMILYIENSYTSVIKRKEGYLVSTKSDAANHGFGVGIAMELTKKYGGSLELEQTEEWFTTFLSLTTGDNN